MAYEVRICDCSSDVFSSDMLYGVGGPAAYDAAGGGAIAGAQARRELKVISFAATPSATGGGRTSAPTSNLFASDSPNYLPANSYAKARVIVGVAAASNVHSPSAPLPVVLRIVGPARSVAQHGQVLTTRIVGVRAHVRPIGYPSSQHANVNLATQT